MNANLIKKYKLWYGVSGAVILLGVIFFAIFQFNYGIDFTGGTMIQIDLGKRVERPQVIQDIESLNLSPQVVHAGKGNTQVIIKTTKILDTVGRHEVFTAYKDKYQLEDSALIASEQLGTSVSSELKWNAFWSVIIASLLMLAYITFRFEAVFGIGAIISLFHDVLVLLAVYAIFRFTVDQTFIAAILTVVGYSINDTIVVYDRIREDNKREKTKDKLDLAANAVTKTFSRTMNTSITTLLVILSLYVLGVSTIKAFALPLLVGVAVGTYSSIFIASSSWALIRNKLDTKGRYRAATK